MFFGRLSGGADFLVHLKAMFRPWINGKPNGSAAQSQCIMDTARDSLVWVLFVLEHIVVIDFQNKGNITREVPRAGLDESKWGGIRVPTGLDGHFEMITRIISTR